MGEEHDEFLFGLKGKKKGGRLEKWHWCVQHDDLMFGIVYDSDHHVDGNTIRTSACVKMHDLDDGVVIETQNSYYYLGEEGTRTDLHSHYLRFYIDNDYFWRP